MKRIFLVYLLPTGLINLGNVFSYLFQLTVIRSLQVSEVGEINAIIALTNVLSGPAVVLPFAVARAMITTKELDGSVGSIVVRSAVGAMLTVAAMLLAGAFVIEPLRAMLRIGQQTTAMLALLLLSTTVLTGVTFGWLQGCQRYIASALAMASIPALRFVFGLLLVVWWQGNVNSAATALALPGIIVFAAGFFAVFALVRNGRTPLPKGTWRNFGRFLLTSSVSSVLLLGFWNLDVVTVRALFSSEASGLYSVAAVLGRIPYLVSVAVANILFSEALVASQDKQSSERAARRVLLLSCSLAAALGGGTSVPLSFFASDILLLFGGSSYTPAAPILQVLCFAMALLALLQIIVTYMLARDHHFVLWLLSLGLATFLALSYLCATGPVDVVNYLTGTIGVLIAVCLFFAFVNPASISVGRKMLGPSK